MTYSQCSRTNLLGSGLLTVALLFSLTLSASLLAEEGSGETPVEQKGHGAETLLVGKVSPEQLLLTHPRFARVYERFQPDASALRLPEDVQVLVFFGTWCHDSEREVPRLLKLLEAEGFSEEALTLIALDYRKREPEGRAALFKVRYTPTAIFIRDDVEVGRIIERPNVSLHEDIKAMFSERG